MAVKITQAIVKDFFHYDPASGLITIKARDRKWFNHDCSYLAFKSRYGGKHITRKDKDGYLLMVVLGTRCLAHKIAWMYMTGEWPNEIDHINGVRDDNSWANLRSVTRQENLKNISIKKNTPHGVLGISFIKETCKWRVKISTKKNKNTHLGVFDNWFDAVCCRKAAENKYGYHKNHGKLIINKELVRCQPTP